jgi:prolyl-tRNA synthetase
MHEHMHAPLRQTQEGHTAHATAEEAEEMAMRMVRIYEKFATQVCLI